MNASDSELLDRFLRDGAEASFTELVRRHADLVHSAALRQTGGDAPAAEDVAQAVFLALARKARSLRGRGTLAGWLYTSTRLAAAQRRRAEARRLARETTAHAMSQLHAPDAAAPDWNQLRPVLDDAMHDLGEAEREAVLLRYFEQRSWAEVGARLGLAENAARMRVERALERLQAALARRGITSTAAALGLALGAHAVAAAPAGLVARLATAALAAGAGAGPMLGASLVTPLAVAALALLLGVGALVWTVQRPGSRAPGADPRAPAAEEGPAIAGTGADAGPAASAGSGADAAAAVTAGGGARSGPGGTDEAGLELTCLDRETGRPVPHVTVRQRAWTGARFTDRRLTGSQEGLVLVPLSPGWTRLELITAAEGFADTKLRWAPERGDVIPASYTVRLERAVLIGGTVVDPEGGPVAGAEVAWSHSEGRIQEPGPESHEFESMAVQTDAAGRWQIHRISLAMLKWIHGHATHPDFQYAQQAGLYGSASDAKLIGQLRAQTHVFRLRPGGVLEGVVVSQLGEPLAGATVQAGEFGLFNTRETLTAADGTFELRGVPQGRVHVTAEAEGYAPKTEMLNLAVTNASVRLELWLGLPLRLRVVDRTGAPIPQADVWLQPSSHAEEPVAAGTAPLHTSFHARTDDEGRLEWADAPLGRHFFTIAAPGYMRTQDVAIPADGQEHLVTLAPALVIQGRVTDAATGEPVPRFRLATGYSSSYWDYGSTNARFSSLDHFNAAFTGGSYRHAIEEKLATDDPYFVVKFEAEGYRPHVSRPLRYDEGEVTLEVALEPAETFEVTVMDPAGQPAGGAMAGLVFPGANLELQADGWFGLGGSSEPGVLKRSDYAGRLKLQDDPQVARVVIAHPAGHLETTLAALASDSVARLRPWGRIEGEFRGAADTLGGRQVQVAPRDWTRGELAYDISAVSGADGRFTLPRVPPGRVAVSHVIINRDPDGSSSSYSRQRVWAEVTSGETARVTFGGHRLTGRLRLPEGFAVPPGARWYAGLGTPVPEPPVAIRGNAAAIRQWSQQPEVREARYHTAHMALELAPDGSFIAEEVGAGEHRFGARLLQEPDGPAKAVAAEAPLLEVRLQVTVPAMAAGSVVDLGEIVAEPPGAR